MKKNGIKFAPLSIEEVATISRCISRLEGNCVGVPNQTTNSGLSYAHIKAYVRLDHESKEIVQKWYNVRYEGKLQFKYNNDSKCYYISKIA